MRAGPPSSSASESATERALAPLSSRGLRLGTETTRAVLDARGRPDQRVPIVLIAGTNGKGSTAALLASMARAAGYRTGVFTSPALNHPREQVVIEGRAVRDDVLARAIHDIVEHAERLRPGALTGFEATVVAALELFAEARLDLAILEAGLGGSRDATNATEPILSILTTIGDDHRDVIGPTGADLAREKAGILRPHRPAVIGWLGDTENDTEPIVREIATRISVPTRFARDTIHNRRTVPNGLSPQQVVFDTDRHRYDLRLLLLGAHQADNVALATLAAETLADHGFLRLDRAAITHGASTCRWPGRLEVVPRPNDRIVLLDGAHNAHACRALARFLSTLGHEHDLLFGALRDKDARAMLAHLAPVARAVTLVAPGGPRSWDPAAWRADQAAPPDCVVAPDLETALHTLAQTSLLVICGSLHLVARARRLLDPDAPEPAASED